MFWQTLGRAITLLLLLAAASTTAQAPRSAIEELSLLRSELRKARTTKDWKTSLEKANALRHLLNEAPNSLLEASRANVHVGRLDSALQELEQFAQMGQSTEFPEKSEEFAPLRQNKGYKAILEKMRANNGPVSLGSSVFELSDSNLLAEDVDYDPRGKRFFLTSVREKKIVVTDGNGVNHDFAKAPDDWPMLAIKVDAAHGVVWATAVALQGYIFAREADWGRSALLCYGLNDGKLLRRVEGPHGSALGDMVLTSEGDVIVSDGEGGGVYRLPAHGEQLERIDNGDFISPQTPAVHPDGKHMFVPDYLRGIALLDIATRQVRWLSMEGKFALNGIDGLYFDHGTLIAVQNGTSPERVVAFRLDTSFTRIESQTIIERSTQTLGDPTHGVVVHGDFYYIANSGWDVIDDKGNLKPDAKPSAAHIMKVGLKGL